MESYTSERQWRSVPLSKHKHPCFLFKGKPQKSPDPALVLEHMPKTSHCFSLVLASCSIVKSWLWLGSLMCQVLWALCPPSLPHCGIGNIMQDSLACGGLLDVLRTGLKRLTIFEKEFVSEMLGICCPARKPRAETLDPLHESRFLLDVMDTAGSSKRRVQLWNFEMPLPRQCHTC